MCLYYLYFCSSVVIVNLSMRRFLTRMVFLLSHKHGWRFLVIISPFRVQCHYWMCVTSGSVSMSTVTRCLSLDPVPWDFSSFFWNLCVFWEFYALSLYLPLVLYSRTNYGQILSVQRYHPSFGLEILFLQPTQISHMLSKERNTYATSLE